jgi:hypothetical protein
MVTCSLHPFGLLLEDDLVLAFTIGGNGTEAVLAAGLP